MVEIQPKVQSNIQELGKKAFCKKIKIKSVLACAGANKAIDTDARALQIWLYKPVGMDEQARQMLQAHNPLAALQLANRAAAAGESWMDGAFAEIGNALLHGTLCAYSLFLACCCCWAS